MGLLCGFHLSCYSSMEPREKRLGLDPWGYSGYLQSYSQSSLNTGNVVYCQLSHHWIGGSIYFCSEI